MPRLRPSHAGIGGPDRTSRHEHGAVAIEHDECRFLVGEPADPAKESFHHCHDDEPAQAVGDTSEARVLPIGRNTVLNRQVPALNIYANSVTD